MRATLVLGLAALLAAASSARGEPADVAAAVLEVKRDLEAARSRLVERREEITDERIELAREIRELEAAVAGKREAWRRSAEAEEERDVGLASLRRKADGLEAQLGMMRSLLVETRRGVDTQMDLVDARGAEERLEAADRSLAAATGSSAEAADLVLGLLAEHAAAAARIRRTPGAAVGPDGRENPGVFVQVGDVQAFHAAEGGPFGIVRLEHGSTRPRVWTDLPEADRDGIERLARDGEGTVPFDVTGGAALRKRESRRSLIEQLRAGGAVMIPILGIGAIGLLVGLLKTVQLMAVRTRFDRASERLRAALARGDAEEARALAQGARRPVRGLLRAATDHRGSRDDLEEALHEAILVEVPASRSTWPCSRSAPPCRPSSGCWAPSPA
jgi:biopolymer transport protein ExbB